MKLSVLYIPVHILGPNAIWWSNFWCNFWCKWNLEIIFYTVFIGKLQKLHLFKSSCLEKVLFKMLQNSLEKVCVRVSLIIMVWAVASVPYQEYINSYSYSGIFFNKFIVFSFVSPCFDLSFEYFILYLHCSPLCFKNLIIFTL